MIEIKNHNFGNLNVFINAYNELADDANLKKISQHNKINLFSIVSLRSSFFKDTIFYNMEWSEENVDHYKNDKKIIHLYNKIENVIKEQDIKIFIWLGDPGILSKEFLDKIKQFCYVSFWTFDDPVNSEKIVKHCARYYNSGFTATVNWDKEIKTSDVFEKWGCPKSIYIPIGVFEGKYKAVKSFENRKYDLIFIGSVFQKRLLFMFKLKKYFGDRLLIFGGSWNGEGYSPLKKILLKVLKWYYKVPKIEKISDEELVYYYQNCKVGINTHMTNGGPSAVRTYELPANGVMQICDSANGLKEIYELGKEVVSYENNNVEDVIEKIEYYLSNEDERIKIAKNATQRTYGEYMVWHSFEKILKFIQKDKEFERYIL